MVLRVRICKTLRISSSRPITGSNLPVRANSLRFLAYLFKELYVSSADAEVTRSPLRISAIAVSNPFSVTPWSFRIWATLLFDLKIAKIKCSIETYSSLIFLAMILASFKAVEASRESMISPPETLGKLCKVLSNTFLNNSTFTFNFFRMKGVTFSSTSNIPLKMCSFSSCWCSNSCASCCACCNASCDLIVKFFKFIF